MSIPTLGYWDIRGNTEPVRMVLHYAGIPFNDKRIKYGEGDDLRAEWLKEKFNLGLDFPNLPYWIEGDLKLTQSTAILRHVARKAKLTGENDAEQAKLEMLEQQAIDLRQAFTGLCYNKPQFEQLRPEFVKSIPDKLKPWSVYLGEKKFLAGDRLTYVDFLLSDVLSIYQTFEATAFTGFPNLASYVQRVESLPAIAKYHGSGVYHKLPYNGKVAAIFGTREG